MPGILGDALMHESHLVEHEAVFRKCILVCQPRLLFLHFNPRKVLAIM